MLTVMPLDVKNLEGKHQNLSTLLRMETEKLRIHTIMDAYEMDDKMKGFQPFQDKSCFSRQCLKEAGDILKAQQVLTGSVERFGGKIIITLRLLDVTTSEWKSSFVQEYIGDETEIQRMFRISVATLFEQPYDKVLAEQLVSVEKPVTSANNLLSLNGPRFGATFTAGENGQRLQAPKSEGGFDMYPVNFIIGYQQEYRYISAGNFQALIEVIGTVAGLEQGRFIPTLTFMNGFRWGKGGWEVGFGPTIRVVRKADGYFDEAGTWSLANQWNQLDTSGYPMPNPYSVTTRLDSRGSLGLSTGMLFAVGRTFRSGYLNIPVNLFVSPRKEGTMFGLSCGFNISRTSK